MTSESATVVAPQTGVLAAERRSRAGVGYSEMSDSFRAGEQAAAKAAESLDAAAGLILLYATTRHDPVRLRDGVRSVLGPRGRLIGGSSMGTITNHELGYEGYQVGVAAISSATMHVDLFAEPGLDVRGELAVGEALATQITTHRFDGEINLLLMYDSIKEPRKELNVATTLLQGMSRVLPAWPSVAGVGMMGGMEWAAPHEWLDDDVLSQSAMALVVSGGVRMDTVILHGCRPSGPYYTVTRSEGTRVLEIDHTPVLEFLGRVIPDKQWQDYPLFVTLGVNRGDKFGDFREEDYSNHLCMAIDHDRRALVMFEPNLVPGTSVQLMRRSIDFAYIGRRVDALFDRIAPRRPFFALYIDCAGRAAAFCGTEREEAEEVQHALNVRGVPLLGMYSGVEIAKVGGTPQGLDWTGVLCVFSE